MTIAELIAELKKYPPDTLVCVDTDMGGDEVGRVELTTFVKKVNRKPVVVDAVFVRRV